MSPFSWIRRKVSEAVALGVSDALRALAPDDEQPPASLDELRTMLAAACDAKALPAATEEPNRKGKVTRG